MGQGPFVSFVVPTLDRPGELERFLASADAQKPDDYEVIIVDQGTHSVEAMTGRHRNVRWIQSNRRGLSLCRNIGLQHVTGRLVVFADDDCVLAEDYLDRLHSSAARLNDPMVFGFGSAVTLEDGQPFVSTFRPDRPASSWNCDTLCSISLVFNRATFERVGMFDERFGVGAMYPSSEETDLVLRVLEARGRGIYLDGLTVRHPSRALTPDLVPRYESFGRGHGALARKHVRNRVFLARFAYGLCRSFGGWVTAGIRRNGFAPLYGAALRGKMRGFRALA